MTIYRYIVASLIYIYILIYIFRMANKLHVGWPLCPSNVKLFDIDAYIHTHMHDMQKHTQIKQTNLLTSTYISDFSKPGICLI